MSILKFDLEPGKVRPAAASHRWKSDSTQHSGGVARLAAVGLTLHGMFNNTKT